MIDSFNFNRLHFVFLVVVQVLHDIFNRFFNVVDTFAHFVDATNYIRGHILESLLHLLQQVLHEGVQLFGGGILFLRHLNFNV